MELTWTKQTDHEYLESKGWAPSVGGMVAFWKCPIEGHTYNLKSAKWEQQRRDREELNAKKREMSDIIDKMNEYDTNEYESDDNEEPLTLAGCLVPVIGICLVLAGITAVAFFRGYFLH